MKASWTAFKSCIVRRLTSLKPLLKAAIFGSALLENTNMYMYDHWLRTLAGEHLIREHVDPKELNPEVFKEDEFCQVQVSFSSPCISAMLATIFIVFRKSFSINKRKWFLLLLFLNDIQFACFQVITTCFGCDQLLNYYGKSIISCRA